MYAVQSSQNVVHDSNLTFSTVAQQCVLKGQFLWVYNFALYLFTWCSYCHHMQLVQELYHIRGHKFTSNGEVQQEMSSFGGCYACSYDLSASKKTGKAPSRCHPLSWFATVKLWQEKLANLSAPLCWYCWLFVTLMNSHIILLSSRLWRFFFRKSAATIKKDISNLFKPLLWNWLY